jgi:hypothetical protein
MYQYTPTGESNRKKRDGFGSTSIGLVGLTLFPCLVPLLGIRAREFLSIVLVFHVHPQTLCVRMYAYTRAFWVWQCAKSKMCAPVSPYAHNTKDTQVYALARTAPARATIHAAARPRGPKPAENTALILSLGLAAVMVCANVRPHGTFWISYLASYPNANFARPRSIGRRRSRSLTR